MFRGTAHTPDPDSPNQPQPNAARTEEQKGYGDEQMVPFTNRDGWRGGERGSSLCNKNAFRPYSASHYIIYTPIEVEVSGSSGVYVPSEWSYVRVRLRVPFWGK